MLKIKRVQRCKSMTSIPPAGAPNWCLNAEALRKFNRSNNKIMLYDYDTENDHNNNSENDEDESRENRENTRKRKKKSKQRKRKTAKYK